MLKSLSTRALWIFCLWLGLTAPLQAAPKMDLWDRWMDHDAASQETIDHSAWGELLSRYLIDSEDGIHRFAYGKVGTADKALLMSYLKTLERTPISRYNRDEQMAYWINFYNALTIQVVLDAYPVKTIKDIDISPGMFSSGPWDAKLTRVEGEELSLNDIEHRILRPIWKDNRIHYAVNCASIGCPNLASRPYTSADLEAMLDSAARDFVNHERGARFNKKRLVVSDIYRWYQSDFGDSDQGVIEHLRRYAEGSLAERLRDYDGGLSGDYDWRLNEP